jgi:hypothetical protein
MLSIYYVYTCFWHPLYLKDQQDTVLSSLYCYTAKSLYMFRVSRAPIIRGTQTLVTTTGKSHEFENVVIKSV